ncbi:hypothetical protein K502DRAFT_326027 [Neoconidiobolus thromboides FSU 785]|nr:hypothetical protein K502DRAFT_326027 [Neoconidiobolus thromboides FSU 785]
MTPDIHTLYDKNEEENKTMINLFFEINTIEPTNEMVLSPLKLNYENDSNLVKKECYKCDATVSLSWWEIPESLIANNDKDKVIECLTVDKLKFYEGTSSKNPYLLCHTCRWFLVETKQ